MYTGMRAYAQSFWWDYFLSFEALWTHIPYTSEPGKLINCFLCAFVWKNIKQLDSYLQVF